MQLIFLGFFNVVALEVLFKLETLLKIVLLPFTICGVRCNKLRQQAYKKIDRWVESTIGMNRFEIISIKQQRVYSQLVFEDVTMMLLDLFIFTGLLNVPKITQGAISENDFYL